MKDTEINSITRRLHRGTGIATSGVLLVACLAVTLLTGCGLQNGNETIAFLRGKTLWAINPDGSGLRPLAEGNIVSVSWSPDHHQYVMRTTQRYAPPNPLNLLGAPDAPGDLSVGSVSGGSTVQITPNLAGLARSDAWWNADGNRLLYRESLAGTGLVGATYVVSQADQPVGIARKPVDQNAGLPVLSPDGSRLASLDSKGNVYLSAPGASGNVIATGALLTMPNSNRPARLLWQPQHDALLYLASGAQSKAAIELLPLGGKPRSLGEVSSLLDLSFSPDGSRLLLRTTQGFAIWNVAQPGKAVFSWTEDDPAALPWWSPAGGRILVQDASGWQLVDIARHTISPLITMLGITPTDIAKVSSWHPAAGSPWDATGNRFVFVGASSALWQGKSLAAPHASTTGLYIADLASGHAPMLIDSGADRSPTWSYLDPSTAFLVMA
jgi:Tol biopolymer transport system component